MGIEVDDMTNDSSIGGSEKIPVSDGGTPKHITTGEMKTYVNTGSPITGLIPFTIDSPGASEDQGGVFIDDAITVIQLNAVLRGSSTPSVTWTIRHDPDRSAAGNEVVTSGTTTTSTSTGDETTSFNDATIPAGSWIWIETTAQSGTVNELNVSVEYTVD